MFYIRIHKSYRNVVAICDKEILGKKFEEGKKQLDIRESFYKDKELTKEQAMQELKKMKIEDSTFNIVGKDSIKLALEAQIIKKSDISYVNGVPFALFLI